MSLFTYSIFNKKSVDVTIETPNYLIDKDAIKEFAHFCFMKYQMRHKFVKIDTEKPSMSNYRE